MPSHEVLKAPLTANGLFSQAKVDRDEVPVSRERAASLSTSRLQISPDRIAICSNETADTSLLTHWLVEESQGNSRTVESYWSPHFVVIDSQPRMLYAVDIGTQPANVHEHLFRQAQGFILVMNTNNRQSLALMERFDHDIMKAKNGHKPPFGVVAIINSNEERVISKREGKVFSRRVGAPYFEVHDGRMTELGALFETMVRQIRDAKVASEEEPAAIEHLPNRRFSVGFATHDCSLM